MTQVLLSSVVAAGLLVWAGMLADQHPALAALLVLGGGSVGAVAAGLLVGVTRMTTLEDVYTSLARRTHRAGSCPGLVNVTRIEGCALPLGHAGDCAAVDVVGVDLSRRHSPAGGDAA